MNKIEEALWQDYNEVKELIKCLEPGDENKNFLLEQKDNIRKELLKHEEVNIEANVKREEMQAENKRSMIRNIIDVGIFLSGLGFSLYGLKRTFDFDQEATVTSTLGRSILNGCVPKMNIFKR